MINLPQPRPWLQISVATFAAEVADIELPTETHCQRHTPMYPEYFRPKQKINESPRFVCGSTHSLDLWTFPIAIMRR